MGAREWGFRLGDGGSGLRDGGSGMGTARPQHPLCPQVPSSRGFALPTTPKNHRAAEGDHTAGWSGVQGSGSSWGPLPARQHLLYPKVCSGPAPCSDSPQAQQLQKESRQQPAEPPALTGVGVRCGHHRAPLPTRPARHTRVCSAPEPPWRAISSRKSTWAVPSAPRRFLP